MTSPAVQSQAMIGYGSRFQILYGGSPVGTSPADWADLGEVSNITLPSANVDQIDVTHMQSPGRTREFIDGLIDAGDCSFDMNYVPGSEGDLILLEILAIPPGRSRTQSLRVVFPDQGGGNEVRAFSGNLKSYEPKAPTDDKMTATVSWKVTSLITRSTLSPAI